MPKQSHSVRHEQEVRGEALEAYLWNTFPAYESTRQPSTGLSSRLSGMRIDAIRIRPHTISLRLKLSRLPCRPGSGRRFNCVEASRL
jgi:hypothetical protein